MRRLICAVFVTACVVLPDAAQCQTRDGDLSSLLTEVSRQIERWYGRAQNVVSRETVVIQPLRADFSPADIPRRLVFELRVGWELGESGQPVASVLREPAPSPGRAARSGRDAGCLDPKPVSPEPLAMLLPDRLAESEFSAAGDGRVDGRRALVIDYRGAVEAPPDVTWTGECVSVSLPGRSRGRVWVDASTYDVLRLDDRLVGSFTLDVPREQVRRGAAPTMVIERAESSIRYKRVGFDDPRESIMLPASVETLTVFRGITTRRVRVSQRFSDYRRFLTGGRILD